MAFTLEDAIRLGHDVFDLSLKSWGNLGTGGNQVFTWPPASITSVDAGTVPAIKNLAAIAINPRSTVDQVRVSFNQGVGETAFGRGWTGYQANERLLAVGAPLDFSIYGGISTKKQRILFRCLPEYCYGDTYYRENAIVTSPFGELAVPEFKAPSLDLTFYLRRPTGPIYTKRGAYTSVSNVIHNAAGEILIGLFPSAGRRRASISLRPRDGVAEILTMRVAAINYNLDGLDPPTVPKNAEKTLATIAGIDASLGNVGRYETSTLQAQYIAVYATRTAGVLTESDFLVKFED